MAHVPSIPVLTPFHAEGANLSANWERWKEAFDFYVDAVGLTADARKRALLLHVGGPELQSVFKTFSFSVEEVAEGARPTYAQVVSKFDEYFSPKRNVTCDRHEFRRAKQQPNETNIVYLTRLRKLSLYCEYGVQADEHIRDQFIATCRSSALRRRLLREENLTLENLTSLARTDEVSENQAKHMEAESQQINEELNFIRKKVAAPATGYAANVKCFRCGNLGHVSRSCRIAQNKTCNACGKIGHFAKVCKSVGTKPGTARLNTHAPAGQRGVQWKKQESVRLLQTETQADDSVDEDYVFTLCDKTNFSVEATVNGKPLLLVVDSGATVNVLTMTEWLRIRADHDKLQATNAKVFSYGSSEPLRLQGQVTLRLRVGKECMDTDFVILDGDYPCLLGRKASVAFGLIQFPDRIQIIQSVQPSVEEVISKHSRIFQGSGKSQSVRITVHVDPNARPIAQPVRRMPYHLRNKVELEIQRLLDNDIIEKVTGVTPWLNPVVPVIKSDGNVRLCLDMRQTNLAVIKQKRPIPTVEDILAELKDAEFISELDFNGGFHQFELEEKSRELTAFLVESGTYRFKRLIFGLNVAPELFQSAVETVLGNIPGVRNLSDNVLVFTKKGENHGELLDRVLTKLESDNLTLNRRKCKFALTKLDFMGYIVSGKGVALGQDKVDCVQGAHPPTTVKELRSFWGLINFCAKFMRGVADLTAPLRELTKKNTPWEWTEKHNVAFNQIKQAVFSSEMLAHFKTSAPTELVVDASPIGLGAILLQQQQDGEMLPVAFASRALTPQEQKYSQTEREALAVIWGCEKFHLYLYGIEFTILTDHKPLEIIYSPGSRPSARIERWALRLQQYRYRVKYVKGDQNIADPLSRMGIDSVSQREKHTNLQQCTDMYVHFVLENALPKALTMTDIKLATQQDEQLQRVLCSLESDHWDERDRAFNLVKAELTVVDGVLLRGPRIVVPEKLRAKTLEIAHESHLGIIKMKGLMRIKVWWPKIDHDITELVNSCLACQVQGIPEKPEPMVSTTWVKAPWHDLALDICGPFNTGESLLVLADYYTRWPEACVTKNTTSSAIIVWLEVLFARFGYPHSLTTDNGPQFISAEFESYLKSRGISHRLTTPYWPQANGQVERMNRVFLKSFRAAVVEGRSWKDSLNAALQLYRNSPHASTGHTPAQLLLGWQPKTKLPQVDTFQRTSVHKRAEAADFRQKERREQYTDLMRNARHSSVQVGDWVLVQRVVGHKLMAKFSQTPFQVTERNGNSLLLRNDEGVKIKRNISQVKKCELTTTNRVAENTTMVSQQKNTVGVKTREVIKRPRRTPLYLKDYVLHL